MPVMKTNRVVLYMIGMLLRAKIKTEKLLDMQLDLNSQPLSLSNSQPVSLNHLVWTSISNHSRKFD